MGSNKFSLLFETSQKLVLTLAMQQAFKVLQLPQYELRTYLLETIENNPLLELPADKGSLESERELVSEITLYEHLVEQVHLNLPETQWERAIDIIGNLDERGFYTEEGAELALLNQIQTFDPPGIAARNLRECLLLQLQRLSTPQDLAIKLISDHYDLLLSHKLDAICKKLKISEQALSQVLRSLASLSTNPAAPFCRDPTETLRPDLILTESRKWSVPLPFDLHIRQDYLGLDLPKDDRKIVREWWQEAQELKRSLLTRKKILLQIGALIYEENRLFFEGEAPLVPLKIPEVARHLGLSDSTLSRAIAQKTFDSPVGLLPLKLFFTQNLKPKACLGRLIEEEDKKKPLTDQQLVEKLRDRGFCLSRRCVAKYRLQAKIPPSYLRKQTRS